MERVGVLSRQVCAAPQAEAQSTAAPDFDPKIMYSYIVHDNAQLRQRIFSFLKVWADRCQANVASSVAQGEWLIPVPASPDAIRPPALVGPPVCAPVRDQPGRVPGADAGAPQEDCSAEVLLCP